MASERILIGQTGRRELWFLVALLMALASALVPAVCASGPPTTRLSGSAFDPQTSAVALRTRSQDIIQAKIVADDGDRSDAAPILALLPAAPREQGQANRARPALAFFDLAPVQIAARHITSAQPRAPPAPIG